MLLSQVFAATSFILVGTVNAIATISAVGNKFFDSTGNQFFVKGKSSVLNFIERIY